MIKIQRVSAPAELTPKMVAELTALYKQTGEPVWNKSYIRDRLLEMSHGKCCYCETAVNEESKYMEVEHFYAKKWHPDKVVEWLNLLPSCKRCNVNKSDHDVAVDGMIVDPSVVHPKAHLRLHYYRLKGRDELGRLTVEAAYLNDTDRLVSVRMRVGEATMETLAKLRRDLETDLVGTPTRYHLNRALRGLRALFDNTAPEKEYCATVATVLLCDDDYVWIKDRFQELSLWNEFAPREVAARDVSLA